MSLLDHQFASDNFWATGNSCNVDQNHTDHQWHVLWFLPINTWINSLDPIVLGLLGTREVLIRSTQTNSGSVFQFFHVISRSTASLSDSLAASWNRIIPNFEKPATPEGSRKLQENCQQQEHLMNVRNQKRSKNTPQNHRHLLVMWTFLMQNELVFFKD
jgi:hypothetical protein